MGSCSKITSPKRSSGSAGGSSCYGHVSRWRFVVGVRIVGRWKHAGVVAPPRMEIERATHLLLAHELALVGGEREDLVGLVLNALRLSLSLGTGVGGVGVCEWMESTG